MGEVQTIGDGIDERVKAATDEELAEHVKDPGLLGQLVRAELTERGHKVNFSDVNGVQEGGVVIGEDDGPRGDSADVLTAPGQTLDQQAEGTEEIDPEYAAGAQEQGAGIFAPEPEADATEEDPTGPAEESAAEGE